MALCVLPLGDQGLPSLLPLGVVVDAVLALVAVEASSVAVDASSSPAGAGATRHMQRLEKAAEQ
jgi:hypothetical protein